MKKYVFGVLFLTAVGIGMVGCKKMNPTTTADGLQNQTKYVSVETIRGLEKTGSILRFKTIEDYVDFVEDSIQIKWQRIDDFTAAQGFENYFVQNPIIDEEDSLAMDEMFGKLLNADAVVIIGRYAVKVDLQNEAVFVAPFENLATHYADLISGNTGNKNVKKFSTDDDVIDYLLTGVDFDKCGGSDSFNRTPNSTIPDGLGGYFTWRARYFKAGIYNVVRIKGYHYWVGSPWFVNSFYENKLRFEVDVDTHWKSLRVRKRPCNSGSAIYHHGGVRQFQNYLSGSTNPVIRVFTAYEQTRALNGYRVHVRGHVEISGTVHTTDWFGRIIHANF